jgi:hypothetical protein
VRSQGPTTHLWAKVLVALGALALAFILGFQGIKWLHVAMMNAGTLPTSQLPDYTPSATPTSPGSGDQALPVKQGQTFRIGETVYGGKWKIKGNEIIGLKASRGGLNQERGPNMLTFTFWKADRALGNVVCSSIKPLVAGGTTMKCPPTPATISGATRVTVLDTTVSMPGMG